MTKTEIDRFCNQRSPCRDTGAFKDFGMTSAGEGSSLNLPRTPAAQLKGRHGFALIVARRQA